MRRSFFIFYSLLISFCITIAGTCVWLLASYDNNPLVLGSSKTIHKSVTVSASIGGNRFVLFGYTSPQALVTIEGVGILDHTYSRNDGYFEFENSFSPFSPRETCIVAQDQMGRITTPTCLPPFPTAKFTTIGPVLLPPTISLDKPDYFIGDEVITSGQTIPNTEVSISTFIDENKSVFNYMAFTLVTPVEAYTFPELITKADEKGNYSLSIPSSHPQFYRLFMQTSYEKQLSPKSTTLSLKILPVWMIIIQIIGILFNLIKSRLLEFIIVAQLIALIMYFMRLFFHPFILARQRALMLRQKFALMEQLPHELMVEEKYPLARRLN